MVLKLWQLHVEFCDSSVSSRTASVLFILFLTFFLHPFSPLEDVLKYLIRTVVWNALYHTPFLCQNLLHTLLRITFHILMYLFVKWLLKTAEMVEGKAWWAKSTFGGSPAPFSQLTPLLWRHKVCDPAISPSCNTSSMGRAAPHCFEEKTNGLGAMRGKVWMGVLHFWQVPEVSLGAWFLARDIRFSWEDPVEKI